MTKYVKTLAVLAVVSLAAAVPVVAQHAGMPGMAMPAGPGGTAGSMMAMMEKMSKEMAAVPMSGDVDRDFVGMMLPHHQGAVDMAKYELAHGKDPAMLKLARAIVAAQDKEIAEMNAWQARHSVR